MATVFHHPKRKTFYHRSIIPRRLQPYFKGREQLWRSLKTADKDEATLKSAQWTASIHRLFLTLKKQGDRMTNEQRERLVTQKGSVRVRLPTGCRLTGQSLVVKNAGLHKGILPKGE